MITLAELSGRNKENMCTISGNLIIINSYFCGRDDDDNDNNDTDSISIEMG